MANFKSYPLPKPLLNALEHMGYQTPTPIQSEAIPHALQGKDILGTAQTGTGKTAAFAIPLVAKLIEDEGATALILTPTRELASQVMQVIKEMTKMLPKLKTALLIGGDSMGKQFDHLRQKPRLIVGTPGRVNDHLKRKTLDLRKAHYLVLDETDRMLDMGFGIQIDEILKYVPDERQTLMFSATLPKEILALSAKYLKNPVRLAVGETHAPAQKIKQDMVRLTEGEKYPRLLEELTQREGSVIIFVKTKRGADKLAGQLTRQQHVAEAIHGDLKQSRRLRVINDFRKQKYRIMVATDVAARGLDIPHIRHVINYDLPQCAEDYIHRIGRTARAGAEGEALNLVSPTDQIKWRAIHRLMNPNETSEERSRESRPPSRKFSRPKSQKPSFKDGPKKFSPKKRGDAKKPFRPKKPSGKFKGASARA